jgi:hypothetical protein
LHFDLLAIGDWPLAILGRSLVVPLLQLQLHLASLAICTFNPEYLQARVHLQSTAGWWGARTNYE